MSVTSYTSPSYDEAPRPLSDEEKKLLKRMFSDYFEVPSEWKAELKADLERDPPILGQATLGVGIGAASALPLEKLASSGYFGSSGVGIAPNTLFIGSSSIRNPTPGYLDLWADTIRFGQAFQDIAISRPAANRIAFAVDVLVFGANKDVFLVRNGPEELLMDSQRLALAKPAGINETPLSVNVGGVQRPVRVGPNGGTGGSGIRLLYVDA